MASNRDNRLLEQAIAARASGDYRRAIDLFTMLLQRHRVSEFFHERGTAHLKCGELDLAIADFDRAIELKPDDSDCYVNRANAYVFVHQHKRAIEDYDEAIRISPTCRNAYNGRGCANEFLGEIESAIADYTQAMLLDDVYLAPVNNLATLYLKQGDLERAKHLLARAEQLAPQDPPVLSAKSGLIARASTQERGHL